MSPIVRRESHRVIRSAANTAMSQARTSGNMSLATQVRKLRCYRSNFYKKPIKMKKGMKD
ncbi:MAG: hypothetical protein U9P07_10830 [Pseudomonadota bacterium]|nr:hypothetical protein [Pseudomonadota bacterium]